jgi:hypothetical protein
VLRMILLKMILLKRKSNSKSKIRSGLRDEPYLIINLILAGVILMIFAYSGIFSPDKDNYPVVCIHEKLTGEPCVSCGLSHSFSLIVRGKISEAYEWNNYGMRVFLFFFSQLILRVVFSMFYLRYTDTRKELILTDCIGSGIIFLVAFWPFIAYIFS